MQLQLTDEAPGSVKAPDMMEQWELSWMVEGGYREGPQVVSITSVGVVHCMAVQSVL